MTKQNKQNFNVDFLSYLSHLKNTPKIEKSTCIKKKKKNSSLTNLTSYMKIYKPVFHNVFIVS